MGSALAEYRKVAADEPPRAIHSEQERRHWRRILDTLMAKSDEQLTAAEARYGETIAVLLETYEKQHLELRDATPLEILVELMDGNGLRQKDLVDVFGSEAAVSYVLNGRRALTLPQITGLARKFRISPAAFIRANGRRR